MAQVALVEKLLGYLHNGFNRDAGAVPVLYLTTADASLSLTVCSHVLTVANNGLQRDTLDVSEPEAVSLQDAADWLSGHFAAVTVAEPALASRPARMLLPSVSQAIEGDDRALTLFAATSLLWRLCDAYALELERAKSAIEAMLAQIRLDWAEAYWLDEWGGWYGLPRQSGEVDGDYQERIIATLFKIKCNNVALELALSRDYGLYTTVYDAPQNGVFNVSMPFDLLAGLLPSEQIVRVTRFINQFKAAGTKLGALQLNAAPLSDAVDSSGWKDGAVLRVGIANRYDGKQKFNGAIRFSPSYQEEVLLD